MPNNESRAQPGHADLVRTMMLARGLERRARESWAGPRHRRERGAGYGSEAVAVGAAAALGPEDRLFASDRFLAAHLLRGLEPCSFLVRAGTDGASVDPAGSNTVGYAAGGAELLGLAAGAALALRLRGSNGLALAIVPAVTATGGRAQAPIAAAVSRRLPLVVVCDGSAGGLAGPPRETRDALDVVAVAEGTRTAAERARAEHGPVIVECIGGGGAEDERADDPGDPIERELRRMTDDPYARRLIAPLRRAVVDSLEEADRRARQFRFQREAVGVGT